MSAPATDAHSFHLNRKGPWLCGRDWVYFHHLLMTNCWILISSFPFYCCPLFLCIDHWGRLSYLFLPFFGTLHSDAYIFPFLLCFSLLFFSQLFVRPPQTAILLFCISFPWGWSLSLSPVQCHEPHSIVHLMNYGMSARIAFLKSKNLMQLLFPVVSIWVSMALPSREACNYLLLSW